MTRMWMTNPRKMCRNHLLGEHKELHQLIGSLNKGKSVQGHLDKGQIEIHNIKKRHEQLVKEIERRGYNHLSPLPKFKDYKAGKINISENEKELIKRCKECRKLAKENTEFSFRKAKISDAEEISKLRRGVFGKLDGENYSAEFVKLINKTNSPQGVIDNIQSFDVFCLTKSKQIIGTIGLKESKIKGLYVRKSYARKGVGTILMNFIEDFARKKGLKKLHLNSEEKAFGFYKKSGYKKIKKVISFEEGIKKINYLMEKKI